MKMAEEMYKFTPSTLTMQKVEPRCQLHKEEICHQLNLNPSQAGFHPFILPREQKEFGKVDVQKSMTNLSTSITTLNGEFSETQEIAILREEGDELKISENEGVSVQPSA